MARRRKKSSSITGMLIEMAVIVGVVVLLSTLLWSQVRSGEKKPGSPLLGDTTPVESQGNTTLPGNTQPEDTTPPDISELSAEQAIASFAAAHGLTVEDYKMGFDYYPERLYDAYEKSPEARDFILNAPLEYGKEHAKDMSEFAGEMDKPPLFMQWDIRWGYTKYAYGLGGLTGCGPTCLSMVDYYYTRNPDHTPDFMMKFAEENGYVGTELDANGKHKGGTEWILFSQGGKKLGYNVKEVPLDKGTLVRYLKAGTPVICHVGECVFTYNGHYILLVGYDQANDRILVNDPNSVALSQRGCTYEEIEKAIKNMWAFTPNQQSN